MTPPGARALAALAVAALLGLSGGAVTALYSQDEEAPASRVDGPDPLDVGVPLENLPCDADKTLVIVGAGDTSNALRFAVRDWERDGVKYLETAKSCDTAYPLRRGETPAYVAYLPPYDSMQEACEERMQSSHRRDPVTRLQAGNTDTVVCACELDRSTLPQIGEDQELTAESAMWTYLYQSMLDEVGLLDLHQVSQGEFDELTIAATRQLNGDIPINPYGYVTIDTWSELRDRACQRYAY